MSTGDDKQSIETGGGAAVQGNVSTGGGDFIGRDQNIETLEQNFKQVINQGNYVERQEIENTIVVLGPEAVDVLTRLLLGQQDGGKGLLQKLTAQLPPENINRQIEEIQAAQRETAAKGMSLAPETAYKLGMLAAYRRDYEAALDYFNEAGQADPDFSDAFFAFSWLQQSLAMDHLGKRDYDAAINRLAQARKAAEKSDPLDPQALAQRGYIAKTLAQISEARKDFAGRDKYYQEAARFFEHVVKLDPNNPSAQNGLGNVYDAAGNLDGAIEAYLNVIELVPYYTAAHHDLAIVYEKKWKQDPGGGWCQKAVASWQKAYNLAPNDPTFTADKILRIGQRVRWLEQQCG